MQTKFYAKYLTMFQVLSDIQCYIFWEVDAQLKNTLELILKAAVRHNSQSFGDLKQQLSAPVAH